MVLGVLLPVLSRGVTPVLTFLAALLPLLVTFTLVGVLRAEAPVRGGSSRVVLAAVHAIRRSVLTERAPGCWPATAESPSAAAEPSATATAPAAASTARSDTLDQRHYYYEGCRGPEHRTTGRAAHGCFSPASRPRPGVRMGILSAPAAGANVNAESGTSGLKVHPWKSAHTVEYKSTA